MQMTSRISEENNSLSVPFHQLEVNDPIHFLISGFINQTDIPEPEITQHEFWLSNYEDGIAF